MELRVICWLGLMVGNGAGEGEREDEREDEVDDDGGDEREEERDRDRDGDWRRLRDGVGRVRAREFAAAELSGCSDGFVFASVVLGEECGTDSAGVALD